MWYTHRTSTCDTGSHLACCAYIVHCTWDKLEVWLVKFVVHKHVIASGEDFVVTHVSPA